MKNQHTFEFESKEVVLRKTTGIEIWVDGKHESYFSSKSNSFNKLYELLLRVSFGKHGYTSVNSVLKIHNRVDEEFHIFLDKIGEDWK